MQVASPPRPSRRQSIVENVRQSNRRMLVMGPPGSGKSTFSASASAFAGDTLPLKERVVCKDVAVIQGDTEGMLGAYSAGLEIPNVYDMTVCNSYDEYVTTLRADLREIAADVKAGTIKFLIVDLALPNRLLQVKLKPSNQKEWGELGFEGFMFFKMFSGLRGCTVIGNAQIKTTESPGETAQAAAAAAAKSVGGERNTYTMDLVKGVGFQWQEHSSLTVSVERKLMRDPITKAKQPEYRIHTQSNGKFEAKSRFGSVLNAELPGTMTLNAILRQGYGEAL